MEPINTPLKTYVKRYYFLHDAIIFFVTFFVYALTGLLNEGGNATFYTVAICTTFLASILSRFFYVYIDSIAYQQTSLVTKNLIFAVLLSIVNLSIVIGLAYFIINAFIFSGF